MVEEGLPTPQQVQDNLEHIRLHDILRQADSTPRQPGTITVSGEIGSTDIPTPEQIAATFEHIEIQGMLGQIDPELFQQSTIVFSGEVMGLDDLDLGEEEVSPIHVRRNRISSVGIEAESATAGLLDPEERLDDCG